MTDQKEYELPTEIVEMFENMRSYFDCRDSAIKNCFTWRRAAYYSKRGNKERSKAWKAIREIYPELAGKDARFNFERETLKVN